MSLGEYIALKRRQMDLTQEELGEQLHVSKSAIAKWETNRGIPDRDNMKNLAELFGTSVDEMYRIIDGIPDKAGDINITGEIIALLEGHGYKVTKK